LPLFSRLFGLFSSDVLVCTANLPLLTSVKASRGAAEYERPMKVQCGQCPAKYAVADERIRDKKVRIHCKRCNAAIVVDGKTDPPLVTTTPARRSAGPTPSSIPASADSLPPGSDPDADNRMPSPRPVAHTIMGGLEAPAAEALQQVQRAGGTPRRSPRQREDVAEDSPEPPSRTGLPAPDRGTTDPPSGANANRWRVALTKQDLRWMTTEEITQAYRDGAVKLETFVFRAGMPTWVTLLEVAEIVTALSESGADVGGARPEANAADAGGVADAPISSPRKVASSASIAERFAGAEQPDSDASEFEEPLPFALVTQRDEGAAARKEASEAAAASQLEPLEASPPAPAGPATAEPAAPIIERLTPAQMLFPLEAPPSPSAAAAPAPPRTEAARGSGARWLWIVVSLVIVLAAAYFLGRRFGLPLR
jgi:predicted Zn finger-like uncharacterized protein